MSKYKEKCVWVDIRKIERFMEELKREAERERNTDKPMTAAQLANFLNCHRYEIYRMVKDEGLPVIKLGPRRFRFDKKKVKKWMKAKQETKGQRDKEIKRRGDK